MSDIRIAACQLDSGMDKEQNVSKALKFIDRAAERNVDLIAFPEMLAYMGPESGYQSNAESIPGPTINRLASCAKEHGIYVHAGSIFESTEDDDRVYNTAVLLDDTGEIVETYRKVHLFDVEIDGEVEYQESANIAPGDRAVTADTPFGSVGLSICYDLRFPEYYQTLANDGARILFVPAAFTLQTGKDHWEPLLRARAIENQAYVVAPGQIGDKTDSIHTYGKSMIVDPWGSVVAQASDREELVVADLNLEYLDGIRTELPSLKHQRSGIY